MQNNKFEILEKKIKDSQVIVATRHFGEFMLFGLEKGSLDSDPELAEKIKEAKEHEG